MTLPNNLLPITAEAALHKLRAGEMLRGYHIRGTINLRELAADETYLAVPVLIEACRLDHLDAMLMQLECPVVLRRVHIGRADFYAAYFLQGLLLEGCEVESYLDFQSGGHNKPGFAVRLLHNTFHGFVNFFDCWYEAGVEVAGNDFRQGTNLLGQPENYPVTFDVPPLIQDNTGRLDHHDEGSARPD